MIASIAEFFKQLIEPETGQADADKALQIATAALLLEMMRMDNRFADEERAAVVASLRKLFGLAPDQLETLLALADQEVRQASGYYQFTSLINKGCNAGQKVRIIENMWVVAMTDGHLDAHEEHLMRKIADLLYVGHADYVAAKRRAREITQMPADLPANMAANQLAV